MALEALTWFCFFQRLKVKFIPWRDACSCAHSPLSVSSVPPNPSPGCVLRGEVRPGILSFHARGFRPLPKHQSLPYVRTRSPIEGQIEQEDKH